MTGSPRDPPGIRLFSRFLRPLTETRSAPRCKAKALLYLPRMGKPFLRVWAISAVLTAVLGAGPEDVFQAIRNNRLEALKGADLAVRDRRSNTPLIYAAGFGSPE